MNQGYCEECGFLLPEFCVCVKPAPNVAQQADEGSVSKAVAAALAFIDEPCQRACTATDGVLARESG